MSGQRVADATKKSGYRLTGDVHFPTVSPLCSKITPVPGGSPDDVAMLMQNTVKPGGSTPRVANLKIGLFPLT